MIKANLLLSDYISGKCVAVNYDKQEAAISIKELLSQIDFSTEVIPENNAERFTRLLTSLKGKPLSKAETELLFEIVNY